MKYMILLLMMIAGTTFSATKKPCFSIQNKIDRKYCEDKKLEALNQRYHKDRGSWKNMNEATKKSKLNSANKEITNRKEQIKMLQRELAIIEKHKTDLSNTKIAMVQPKKKKKRKKKKKKKDNSLEAQLKRALNIK